MYKLLVTSDTNVQVVSAGGVQTLTGELLTSDTNMQVNSDT